jgi:hypothetical protein
MNPGERTTAPDVGHDDDIVETTAPLAGTATDAIGETEGDDDTMGDTLPAVLVRLALARGVELFHDSAAVAFARVPVGNRYEVWQLNTERFKQWLRHALWADSGRMAKREGVREAIAFLEAMAQFDGPQAQAHLRTAWTPDGSVAYNLANEDGQVVRITGTDWAIEDVRDVAFLRREGVLPLPTPQPGGSIDLLRRYVNAESEEDFLLIVGWSVMTLRPVGPFPILILQGEQGSGKSTAMRALKEALDPVKAPIRAAPGSERDLVIAAASNSLIAIDNVSTLNARTSDALCRISTGGGFATRALYTNDEERVFEQMRAVAINGIDAVATRQDLLDRAIVVRFPRIGALQDEASLWQAFARDRPQIMGALLDGASRALSGWDAMPSPATRMADFARWAMASMPAFGWSGEQFLTAYEANRSNALRASLEGSVLSQLIEKMLGALSLVDGTPTAIHTRLSGMLDDGERRSSGFPRSAQAMSKQLTMLAPALREIGIDVRTTSNGSGNRKTRWMVVERIRDADASSSGTQGTEGTHPPTPADAQD